MTPLSLTRHYVAASPGGRGKKIREKLIEVGEQCLSDVIGDRLDGVSIDGMSNAGRERRAPAQGGDHVPGQFKAEKMH